MLIQLSGKAASICRQRSSISKSGILLAFSALYEPSLSSVTVEFLRCALLAGHYRFAERVIADDWPRPAKAIPVELVLRYFYMRGMVHVGCDHFQLAIRSFWTAVSIPSDTASVIAVDAWKKMVLAKCLVLRDSLPSQSLVTPPPGASSAISRFLTGTASSSSSSSSPEATALDADSAGVSKYIDLVKACHSSDRRKFKQIQHENAALWESDRNTGLVERLSSDLEHRQVLQLASVYSSLPLSHVSAELELSEEEALSTLKQVGDLNFRYENGMVWFEATGACPIGAEDARSLIKLSETIRKLDASIANSSRYQSIKVESGKPPRGVDDF